MRIIGLTRVRNEGAIIKDTLDHMATFCDEVYVYDDCSTDNTEKICIDHKIVKGVWGGDYWDKDRERAEYKDRQKLLEFAREESNPAPDDWFIYMDADERVEFDINILSHTDAVRMRLFDFYITEEDINKHYTEREYIGPEYRDILFMFKNKNTSGYSVPDQREATLTSGTKVIYSGYVKHYGKSISIQQWEDTCEYYATNFPKYSEKWNNRRGKAVHTISDFGRPLIKWEDIRSNKIVKL
tara:strand:+ start:77 stop:799 length:723 start_codon:yes stop_codon:yes gene_type:complete